jgi:arsenate reductase
MSDKQKVLFICVHNSARSQMAETYLKDFAGDRFDVESAGFEPGVINPLVVEVMKEEGYDLSQNTTQSVFDLFKEGKLYDHVITVCDESSGQQCPVFPGITSRLHWPFADPSSFEGTWDEKLAQTREVRDTIKAKIKGWISSQ